MAKHSVGERQVMQTGRDATSSSDVWSITMDSYVMLFVSFGTQQLFLKHTPPFYLLEGFKYIGVQSAFTPQSKALFRLPAKTQFLTHPD